MRTVVTPRSWLLLPVVVAVLGCGADERNSPTALKLKALANFYLDYAVAQRGQGPANEQAFKKHIRSVPDFQLKANGLDPAQLDATFVSDRDQEPFVVAYGTPIARISGYSTPAIAQEK